jgi:hypothetical protein
MESNFEHAIGGQKYLAALIAAFERFFQRRKQPNSTSGMGVALTTEYQTPLDRQDIYLDPDPPTPHWGC